ncbi:carboxymuconolactone decarboxylase family protein [Streptomyces sp. NPDC002454]|uniref:carboxymuconolactone decarboxylase family protein n=1 Tax=Streptomyces sp. NPDC049906 TaxID=3155656 RepID=UPI00342C1AE7
MTTTENRRPSPTGASSPYAPEEPSRFAWAEHAPESFRALLKLSAVSEQGPLDPALTELVKVRASQLNQCALCLDMHSKDALAAGETVERLIQLSAWRESRHFYTERELAALELTEAMTNLQDGFVPDEVFAGVAARFDEAELAQLITAIAVINTWNRISVTVRRPAGHYQPGTH